MNDICQAPFTGFVIGPQGDICYCCMGIHDDYKLANIEEVDDLEDFFINSKKLNTTREKFIAGQYATITPCSDCFKIEKTGGKSFKHSINNKFPHHISDNKIKFLEFTSSNICNAICATCNSAYSSSWKKYENLFGREEFSTVKLSKKSIEKIKKILPGLEWLIIKGGEPFADDNNFDILEDLFKINQKCNIDMVTNMSILKDKHIQILKKNVDKVNITVSIDGTSKIYNWIRSTNFDHVIENMEKLHKETNIKFGISITVSLYNYFNIVDIFEYFSNKDYIKFINYGNVLRFPLSSSIQSLPKDLFEIQKKKICNMSVIYDKVGSKSANYLKNFQHTSENKQIVFDHIDKINQIRGFDICDYVPELKAWRG